MRNKIKYDSAVFVVDLKGIALTNKQKEIIEEEIKEVIRRNTTRFYIGKYLFLNEDLFANDRFYNLCPQIVGIWIDELKVKIFKQLVNIKKS